MYLTLSITNKSFTAVVYEILFNFFYFSFPSILFLPKDFIINRHAQQMQKKTVIIQETGNGER